MIEQQREIAGMGLPRCQARDLNRVSRLGLWQILLFLLISIGAFAYREFDLLGSLPGSFRLFLGSPPPAYLISMALALYYISALMIILNQMSNDTEPTPNWSPLGYRATFYFFYAISGSLANHFMAVFFLGMFLYGVERVRIWTYNNRVAHQDKGLLNER